MKCLRIKSFPCIFDVAETFSPRFFYPKNKSLPGKSIFPKTRDHCNVDFLSITSSEHQEVLSINRQQKCLINGFFGTPEIK